MAEKTKKRPRRDDEITRPDRAVRFLLAFLLFLGCVFSLSALLSCNFLVYNFHEYDQAIEIIMNGTEELPIPVNQFNVTIATIGLTRWNPNLFGCRKYRDLRDADSLLLTSRIAAYIACITGFLSFGMLLVELVCIRFVCSRCVVSTLLSTAILAQTITFLVYAAEFCQQRIGAPYRCQYSTGTSLSIVAFVFYLVCAALCCNAKKSKPLVRQVLEQERAESENDPCCYCLDLYKERRDRRRERRRREEEERELQKKLEEKERLARERLAKEREEAQKEEEMDNESEVDPSRTDICEPAIAESEAVDSKLGVVVATNGSSAKKSKRVTFFKKKSFANAEVVGSDLFFDTKTV